MIALEPPFRARNSVQVNEDGRVKGLILFIKVIVSFNGLNVRVARRYVRPSIIYEVSRLDKGPCFVAAFPRPLEFNFQRTVIRRRINSPRPISFLIYR